MRSEVRAIYQRIDSYRRPIICTVDISNAFATPWHYGISYTKRVHHKSKLLAATHCDTLISLECWSRDMSFFEHIRQLARHVHRAVKRELKENRFLNSLIIITISLRDSKARKQNIETVANKWPFAQPMDIHYERKSALTTATDICSHVGRRQASKYLWERRLVFLWQMPWRILPSNNKLLGPYRGQFRWCCNE